MSGAVLATIGLITLVIVNRSPSAKARSDSAATSDAKAADPAGGTPSASTAPATTAAPPTTRSATPSKPPTTPAADAKARLATAIKALSAKNGGRLSVAVTDLNDAGTGVSYADGSATYDTASIVKVDILATLLLRHQKAGTRMTSSERSQATVMIQQSDNNAATALWNAINRKTGLDAANSTFGMHHTEGGSTDLWGLTQTTPADQQALLRVVFGGSDSPLTAASRDYIKDLMHTVTKGQQWGVSAADEDDTGFALKNGWLQRTATGLWDINSIGQVDYKGHTLLVCVLSSGNKSEKAGIDKIEDAAEAAAEALYS
ncbi:Beta-lactamase class A [Actinacidiphila paucisporea]|uniref:Beta-lactamase class A n=1 Tax=Actinacidiphila paucisporea TaxID=310782 RepID=A0A1M7QPV7_9ACTN|nr:Beta-lactamase class A [Actinacidiphila paucisporea]